MSDLSPHSPSPPYRPFPGPTSHTPKPWNVLIEVLLESTQHSGWYNRPSPNGTLSSVFLFWFLMFGLYAGWRPFCRWNFDRDPENKCVLSSNNNYSLLSSSMCQAPDQIHVLTTALGGDALSSPTLYVRNTGSEDLSALAQGGKARDSKSVLTEFKY